MAIKTSNQITFSEHKKIVEIKEWYLATSLNSGITNETEGWTTDIQTINYTNKYLWNYEEVIYSIGLSEKTEPVIIGAYGESGSNGASLQVKYISSETVPVIVNNDVSKWSDTVPNYSDGQKIYMTQKLSSETDWSIPIQISANDGESPTMTIINGYWYVNGESTGVKAEGEDGKTPELTIGENGNWFIDGVDSGTKAQGEAGKDGSNIEYVYYRSENEVDLATPSYSDGVLTDGWTPSPQGITEVYKYEYISIRNKPADGQWSDFSTPVIWSKWGEKGQDGDGIEYRYYLSNSSDIPEYEIGDNKWTDDPTGVSIDYQYEYVVQIKTSNGESKASAPALWAKYGEDGNGISSITNYYLVTQTMDIPESAEWKEEVQLLSPENKYLWNYEKVVYTDGTIVITDPAIIGVYGDSGEAAITFEIYSTQGFMFKEGINEIELKIAAFKGSVEITDATYTWERWDQSLNNGDGGYVAIVNDDISKSIIIHKSSLYYHLKCTMTYNGNLYEDYVDLTDEIAVYSSTVKFFEGSNVFNSTCPYLIAYVSLYRNNTLVDSVLTNRYYVGKSSISGNQIVTDMEGEFEEESLMYFVYKDNNKYSIVLGKYQSDKWIVYNPAGEYIYTNDLHNDSISNIIIISRNEVSKSRNIDFEVYKKQTDENGEYLFNDDTHLSSTNVIVIDTNDPIVSDTAPEDVDDGQLWLDTSSTPYILKIYTKYTKQQYILGEGKKVYLNNSNTTSKTFLYGKEEDIVVLEDGNISMDSSCSTVDVRYDTYTNANVLKGMFYSEKDSNEIYYMNSDSEITRKITEESMPNVGKIKWYWVYASNVQSVSLDTSDGKWENFSQQNGGVVYTSKPSSYKEGDLWILGDGEICGEYGPGTMLKATTDSESFNESHWIDAMEENTKVLNNIKQYFEFNADTGLKIGQKDEKFYVNISSTEMGFYDNSNGQNEKVVNISNNSANIKNAIFDGAKNTTFNNNAIFNQQINMYKSGSESGFAFQIESNGSFSLIVLN